MERQHALFQVGQKALIERGDDVLVMFFPNGWLDLPGGRIEVGETDLVSALKREVREETSLEIEVGETFATSLARDAAVYLVVYKCSYVSGEVALSDEHSGYRWVNRHDFPEVDDGTSPFTLDVLRRYFDEEPPVTRSGLREGDA